MGRYRHSLNPAFHRRHFYTALDDVLTVSEAARLAQYPARYVRSWCDEGKIAARISGGVWLISRASLLAFLRLRMTQREN
ncbi:helix-turn-helix domain-containing protein [Staphylococcus aureus]|uniref:helix-turn-helix domain-containing protein n=1 Tax=Staphylococcus aureus TaxID=1280 RepID=UPI003D181666